MPSISEPSADALAETRRHAVWRERSLATPGGTLAVFEAGRDDAHAPVVVLIHGLGHWSQAAWTSVAARLAETHRLVAFDLPGFGASAKPDVGYPLARFVDATRAVVEALALERFTLVGHSLGGLVAAAYASEETQRVRALGLLDPAGFLRTPKLLVRIVGSRLVTSLLGRIRPSRGFVRRTFDTAVFDRASVPEWMHDRMWELAREPAMTRAFARVYRDALREFLDLPGLHRRLERYRGPVLLVWGRDDRYVPVKALAGAQAVYPQAQTVVLERCGHCPNIEYPDVIAERIAALVARGT